MFFFKFWFIELWDWIKGMGIVLLRGSCLSGLGLFWIGINLCEWLFMFVEFIRSKVLLDGFVLLVWLWLSKRVVGWVKIISYDLYGCYIFEK